MKLLKNVWTRRILVLGALLAVATAVGVVAVRYPSLRETVLAAVRRTEHAPDEQSERESETSHEHDHGDESVLELSEQARRAMGLTDEAIGTVRLATFERPITLPAVTEEQPGRTRIEIAAALTGVVSDIGVLEGETVSSGDLLFRLRLTHQDLVAVQTKFLETLGRLDVVEEDIARLKSLSEGLGAARLRERIYEKNQLEAILSVQRESLLLHGLNEQQVEDIVAKRTLLREVRITVPFLHSDESLHQDSESLPGQDVPVRPISRIATDAEDGADPVPLPEEEHLQKRDYVVRWIGVNKGQSVQTGDRLATLADYSELFIAGQAFEQDVPEIERAMRRGWKAEAIRETADGSIERIAGLTMVYIDHEIDPQTRLVSVHVRLPNVVVDQAETADGHRFVTWKYRPGERMRLRIPVERWPDRIVLPAEAVAQDGAESYVFVLNGDHFERRTVEVQYRDRFDAVLANDGSLVPGERVALKGAHQLQMALKAKSGGGAADAHAHHHH